MSEKDEQSPYEVFDGTPWEAGLLKSILDDNEIDNMMRDSSRIPWNTFPVGTSTVKVYVAHKDLQAAETIVKDFRQNMLSTNEAGSEEETP